MKTRKELSAELDTLQKEAQSNLHKRIFRSIIRWLLTILLYYYFWHLTWVRWSLVIVLPMILFNIGFMGYSYNALRKQIRAIKNKLDQLV